MLPRECSRRHCHRAPPAGFTPPCLGSLRFQAQPHCLQLSSAQRRASSRQLCAGPRARRFLSTRQSSCPATGSRCAAIWRHWARGVLASTCCSRPTMSVSGRRCAHDPPSRSPHLDALAASWPRRGRRQGASPPQHQHQHQHHAPCVFCVARPSAGGGTPHRHGRGVYPRCAARARGDPRVRLAPERVWC